MQWMCRSQKRDANAKRQQTYHSQRESLMTNLSQETGASGEPDAMFSCHDVFKFADPSSVGKSLLDGNKDHVHNQARSEFVKQEHQVGRLDSCIEELRQQACAQRLALQDAQCGSAEFRREQVRLQEELSVTENVHRNNQTRWMHERRQMKRAQELRVDDFSVQKFTESPEAIQRLTSQFQEWQDQMNSMSDSGEFQEAESNYSGSLSHVSSQPAMFPSSRSMLSRDTRLPLDTCNRYGLQENVLGNQISTFDSVLGHPQVNLMTCKESVKELLNPEGRIPFTRVKTDKIKAQFECRHLQQSQ